MALILSISDFINRKILLCMVVLTLTLLLTGCEKNFSDVATLESDFSSESAIIAIDDYYRIYHGTKEETRFFYYYDLFDIGGNLIKSECTYMDEPNISEHSNNIIKVSTQTGTGQSTRWSYYYDVNTNLFSRVFYHVLAEKENVIAYFDGEQIILCDMFDAENFYKEIELNNVLSDSTDPIEEVFLSDNLDSVTVVYFTGNDFDRTTETFSINGRTTAS